MKLPGRLQAFAERTRHHAATWSAIPSWLRPVIWDAVIERTPDIHFVKDLEGRYLLANRAFRDLFGIPPERLHEFRDADHPNADVSRVAALTRERIAQTGEVLSMDLDLRHHATGEARIYHAVFRPLLLRGKVIGICCCGRDITDRIRIEKALRDAKEEAEEANRSKSRFLAAASHDLRQPLQGAILLADALSGSVPPGRPAEALGNLSASLDSLRALVDSLLDLSQLETGIRPRMEGVSVARVLSEIEASYGPVAEAKRLRLVVVSCDEWVRTDRVLLSRMLRNLVENAIRYTERGRVLIECIPSRDGRLLLEVRDTGPGIPEAERDRVWEEFRQLDNPTRDRRRGLGIGLAIVRRLSRILDHPVNLSSEPGQGSTFTISLPQAGPGGVPAAAATHPDGPAQPPPPIPSGSRILVIEDDEFVLPSLRTLLGGWGAEVLVARDADEAVQAVARARFRPEAVLSDYRLPGENGVEAVIAVRRAAGTDLPAVLLTGEISEEIEREAGVHGLTLIRKPVSAARLAAVLDALLSSSSAREDARPARPARPGKTR